MLTTALRRDKRLSTRRTLGLDLRLRHESRLRKIPLDQRASSQVGNVGAAASDRTCVIAQRILPGPCGGAGSFIGSDELARRGLVVTALLLGRRVLPQIAASLQCLGQILCHGEIFWCGHVGAAQILVACRDQQHGSAYDTESLANHLWFPFG